DAVADARGDLGEVEAVLDDDVEVDGHLAAVAADLDAARPSAGPCELPAQGAFHPDDAVALERRLRDDLRDRLARDRDPPKARGNRLSSLHLLVGPPTSARGCEQTGNGSGSSTTSRRTSSRRLERLLDLAGLEAARADVGARRLALDQDADALEVRLEAPLRGHHRVTPVVTEAGFLPAACADLGHRRPRIAEPISGPCPATAPSPAGAPARRGRPSRARPARHRRPCRRAPPPARPCPR